MIDSEHFYQYESRIGRPINAKIPEFQTGDRLRHLIFAEQLTRGMIDRISRTADRIRAMHRAPGGADFLRGLLPNLRAMLYFTQPSTRTFLSFTAACQILGMSCNEVRDPSVSSESKNESPFDSMRMFSSYFDVVIMRSRIPQFSECCAYMMNDLNSTSRRNIPVVNAGSGADEHPTQALLDIYTIQRVLSFKSATDSSHRSYFEDLRKNYPDLKRGIEGKTIGFCGDVLRGRTIRSLVKLLMLYKDVQLYFFAPPKIQMGSDLRSFLLERSIRFRELDSFLEPIDGKSAIEHLDILYMTRFQKEHNRPEDEAEFESIDFSKYKLSPELVSKMRPYAAILHPFPRDEKFGEIPTSIDLDPRAFYFRQARNGMWTRAAILASLFDVDGKIADYYDQLMSETKDYNTGAI